MSDTIYALSSAAGKAGVAIIRISGPHAHRVAQTLTKKPVPVARLATLVNLYNVDDVLLDNALLLAFNAPASFTGEDCVELHIHGGRASLQAVFAAISQTGVARMAEAGEFTRRAFLNGKLDLAEAEGLIDLIEAETEGQRRQALRQMQGALSDLYNGWHHRLAKSLAHIEADIDFSDEDLPSSLTAQRMADLQNLITEMAAHLADARRGERLREGIAIAILGAPNAGKSSLLNVLAQRDAAIVSERAGTTRDVVDVHLDLAGVPVLLADTAGLRDASDAIEAEGIKRALARAEHADLKLIVFDATLFDAVQNPAPTIDKASLQLIDANSLVLINKSDCLTKDVLHSFSEKIKNEIQSTHGHAATPALTPIAISAKNGAGIAALINAISHYLQGFLDGSAQPPLTRARHREAVTHAHDYLNQAVRGYQNKKEAELIAEDIRLAMAALGRVTGRVGAEDLLDIIFRDFCIGK